MKRSILLILLPLAATLPVHAQFPMPREARATGFVGLGASAPVNPLANHVDTGFNLAGGIGLTTEYVGVMFDVMYNRFGINDASLNQVGASGGHQSFWAVTVDPIFHVNQRGPVDFYVTGGAGIYGQILTYTPRLGGPFNGSDFRFSHSIYKGGVDGGAGFAFNIGYYNNPVKFFIEARVHHMFTAGSGASFVPVTVGVRF